MAHEVIVVGGGIGGLTTAALLSARGVNVCLIERGDNVGGCASVFEKFGYEFELGFGVYSGWTEGEIYQKIFDELKTEQPKTILLNPAYTVCLPDGFEISITNSINEVEDYIRTVFPECADDAIAFYKKEEFSNFQNLSTRFRSFISAQQQIFGNNFYTRKEMHTITGGIKSLSDILIASFKKNGGVVRLNSPALRLAFDSDGLAVGVDLLNGERVESTKAIVSNLSVWDTFGRLIGLNRTPSVIRQRLKNVQGQSSYLIFLSVDEKVINKFPSKLLLAVCDWEDTEKSLLTISVSPKIHNGKRAVTVFTFANPEDWFQFQESQDAVEELDQTHLEKAWRHLNLIVPELGDNVEIIETFTPKDFYELTRRRLGMVFTKTTEGFTYKTNLPNVYIVSDTVTNDFGIAAVSELALKVVNEIAPKS